MWGVCVFYLWLSVPEFSALCCKEDGQHRKCSCSLEPDRKLMGRSEAKAGSGGCDLQVTWVRSNCMCVCTFMLACWSRPWTGDRGMQSAAVGLLDRKWCRIWAWLPIPELIFLATAHVFRHVCSLVCNGHGLKDVANIWCLPLCFSVNLYHQHSIKDSENTPSGGTSEGGVL